MGGGRGGGGERGRGPYSMRELILNLTDRRGAYSSGGWGTLIR